MSEESGDVFTVESLDDLLSLACPGDVGQGGVGILFRNYEKGIVILLSVPPVLITIGECYLLSIASKLVIPCLRICDISVENNIGNRNVSKTQIFIHDYRSHRYTEQGRGFASFPVYMFGNGLEVLNKLRVEQLILNNLEVITLSKSTIVIHPDIKSICLKV